MGQKDSQKTRHTRKVRWEKFFKGGELSNVTGIGRDTFPYPEQMVDEKLDEKRKSSEEAKGGQSEKKKKMKEAQLRLALRCRLLRKGSRGEIC